MKKTLVALAVASLAVPAFAADADLYKDVIQPIFKEYCVQCHGEKKAKHKLRLDTHEFVMKGDKEGAILKAGDPSKSRLVKALTRPVADEEHMPPSDEKQLSEGQIAAIKWWIEKGAPASLLLKDAGDPPAAAKAALPGAK